MKYIFKILVLITITTSVYSQKNFDIKPINKKPVIIISGNNKIYYPIEQKENISFPVKGIDKIFVYTRLRLMSNKQKAYTIAYKFNKGSGSKYKVADINQDKKSCFVDKNLKSRPSLAFKHEIVIPKGIENIEFTLLNSNNIVDLKILTFIDKKKVYIQPNNKEDEQVIKIGKVFSYYKLNSKIKTIIKPNGTGKLVVFSRKRLSANDNGKYSFTYKINNSEINVINVPKSTISKSSTYKSYNIKELPSNYKKTVIEIKDENQIIEFSSNDKVDARFVFYKDKQKKNWIDFKLKHEDTAVLVAKKSQKERLYYRISSENRLHIKDIKGTKMRIIVRGEFTYDMHSGNDYILVLKDEDMIIKSYKLSCTKSTEMEYKFNDDMVPGTLDKIYINIPKGNHNYYLEIKNHDKTALIRVSYIN